MRVNRDKRLLQEADILSGRNISIDYLKNVFVTSRQTIVNDLKMLRKRGYNVKKVYLGYYTIK